MSLSTALHGAMRAAQVFAAAILFSLGGLTATTTSLASSGSSGPGLDMFGVAVGGSIQSKSASDRNAELDAIKAAGGRWVRLDIHWSRVQAGGPDSYDWSAHDAAIQAVLARDLKVLAMIGYTPKWARSGDSDKYPPDDPADYAAFANEAVERYSAMGVHHYEIWNEPNIRHFWRPAADVRRYTDLLKAAYPAIKSADPAAMVLNGGFAPATTEDGKIAPRDFLAGIYAEGGAGSFDHLSHHPYNYPAFPGDPYSWSAWHQMCGTTPSLRSIMVANGDASKEIWATEFGAPTDGPTSVSEADQAEMITRGYSLWKDYGWAGPLFAYQGRDLGTDTSERENFFGLLRFDFSEKPSYAAYRAVANGSFDDTVVASCATADAGDSGAATGDSSSSSSSSSSPQSPSSGPSTTAQTSLPAKLEIRRARIRKRHLVVRGSLDAGAAGNRVQVTFRAAGRRLVMRPLIRANGRFRVNRRLHGQHRNVRAGRLVVRFTGNEDLRPVVQRLRAARRPVRLRFRRARIRGNGLVVAGRVAPRARRRAQIEVAFQHPNGAPAKISTRTRVNRRGRFRMRLRVPRPVRRAGASVSLAHPGRAWLHGQRLELKVGG